MELDLPEIDQEKIRKIKMEQQKEIYKDSEISSFIESNNLSAFFVYDNLGIFVRYLDAKKMCQYCPGVNKCKTNGYRTNIIYNEGKISDRICQCDKRKDGDKLKSQFVKYDGRNDLLYYLLKDCLYTFANQRKEIVSKMAQMIKNNDFSKGIYLYGESGIGKSFLMHAFANQIAKKNIGMMCYINLADTIPDLINDSFKDKDGFEEDMELFKTIPFLFIDNFGEEDKNDYSKSNILLPILKEREEKNLPTFITSIYSVSGLKEAYKTPKTLYANTNDIINFVENNCEVHELIHMKYPL